MEREREREIRERRRESKRSGIERDRRGMSQEEDLLVESKQEKEIIIKREGKVR